jgi:hypothetical protein
MGQGRGVMGPDGEGLRGLGAQLTDDQRQQLDDLMDEHRADMQAWWDEYGEDPSASGAQEALQELRDEHRQEMQKLLNDLGIEAGGWGMGRDRDDRATPDAGSGSTTPCPNCDNEGISY